MLIEKIDEIQGLRGYLAVWVLINHVLNASGLFDTELTPFLYLFTQAQYAVDIFIIISGFVIFLLLDRQKQKYTTFITERFFRLYPLMLLLFLVGIFLTPLLIDNTIRSNLYLSDVKIASLLNRYQNWYDWLPENILLHLTMLHGTIPSDWIPSASSAFLGPAWSVSLEWQFYLVVPFAYKMLCHSNLSKFSLVMSCLLLCILSYTILPRFEYGSFLANHIAFFFLGACSYFLYKHMHKHVLSSHCLCFIVGISMLFLTARTPHSLIPIVLWLTFLALIMEPSTSLVARYIKLIFTNRFSLWFGKISYSIYLSHELILIVMASLLLKYGKLTQIEYFLVLMTTTFIFTLGISNLLYKYVERKGIHLGRKLLDKKPM